MAKDPAFLFYSQDFLTGTMFFTDEQVGKYIRLLIMQHQTGHLSKEDMIKICKTYDKDVFKKFILDSDGLYYNERLENEVLRRKAYSKSRSDNRKNTKAENNISLSYDIHMETETILLGNIPNNTIIGKMKKILSENGLVFKELELPQLRESAEFMLNTKSLETVKENDVKIFEVNWTKVVKYALENKKYYGSVSAIAKHLTKILTNIETDNGEEMVRYRVPFEPNNIKTMTREKWNNLPETHTLTMVND